MLMRYAANSAATPDTPPPKTATAAAAAATVVDTKVSPVSSPSSLPGSLKANLGQTNYRNKKAIVGRPQRVAAVKAGNAVSGGGGRKTMSFRSNAQRAKHEESTPNSLADPGRAVTEGILEGGVLGLGSIIGPNLTSASSSPSTPLGNGEYYSIKKTTPTPHIPHANTLATWYRYVTTIVH